MGVDVGVVRVIGWLCFAGIAAGWLAAPPSDRVRFISELLVRGQRSAVLLKACFTAAGVLFLYAAGRMFADGAPLDGALAGGTALALLALTWIDMPPEDCSVDAVAHGRCDAPGWWRHPAAAQTFFTCAAGYQLLQLFAERPIYAIAATSVQLAMTAWLALTTVYAASEFGWPTPARTCAALLDRRLEGRAGPVRAAEWPAALALAVSLGIAP